MAYPITTLTIEFLMRDADAYSKQGHKRCNNVANRSITEDTPKRRLLITRAEAKAGRSACADLRERCNSVATDPVIAAASEDYVRKAKMDMTMNVVSELQSLRAAFGDIIAEIDLLLPDNTDLSRAGANDTEIEDVFTPAEMANFRVLVTAMNTNYA